MATIVINLKTATSHYFTALALARLLRARGHRVAFLGIADEASYVPQEFEFVPVLEDSIPKGLLAHLRERARVAPVATHAAYLRVLHRAIASYARGEVEDSLRSLGAELVLADVHMQPTLLSAHRIGIPYLAFATDLCAPRVAGIPPIGSAVVPDGTWPTRARAELSWLCRLASSRVLSWTGWHGWPRWAVERLARRAGFPTSRIEQLSIYPSLAVPTIVACPRAFDFKNAQPPHRRYVDALVDLDRDADDAGSDDEAWRRSSAPLIYCSLGTNSALLRSRASLFGALIDVLRKRQDLQCLLHVGSDGGPNLGPIPSNVHLARWVPQLQVLRRAAVVISHGGLGSVKECIMHAKPMIVVPQFYDQASNAARVVHHGLGLALHKRRVTSNALSAGINLLLHSRSHKQRLEAIRGDFLRDEAAQLAVHAVESALA